MPSPRLSWFTDLLGTWTAEQDPRPPGQVGSRLMSHLGLSQALTQSQLLTTQRGARGQEGRSIPRREETVSREGLERLRTAHPGVLVKGSFLNLMSICSFLPCEPHSHTREKGSPQRAHPKGRVKLLTPSLAALNTWALVTAAPVSDQCPAGLPLLRPVPEVPSSGQ